MLKRTLCLICSLSTGSFKYNVRYMRHIDAVTLGRKVQRVSTARERTSFIDGLLTCHDMS